MNSEKLQQLEDEITQKMGDGLQNQHFDKLLEKYDVLGKAKLKFQFTLELDINQSIKTNKNQTEAVKKILKQEVAPLICGFCVPCPSNNNPKGCIGCC